MKKLLYLLFALSFSHTSAQDLQLIKTLKIDAPSEVSLDRGGNIYYATFNGDIIKLSPQLEDEKVFSPANPNTTNMLEAWQGLRVFSFHRDLQQYRLINRNLSLHQDYSIPQDVISFAEMATPSFDNNIWVIDQVDFSLVKYDITLRELKSRTPLDQLLNPENYDILLCKEYQNKLFISTQNQGILIFDNLGSYIKSFQHKGISSFNFWKDSIYFLSSGELVKLHLYNEFMNTMTLPEGIYWKFVLVQDENIYLFSGDELRWYQ
jgi:hypothetical protein